VPPVPQTRVLHLLGGEGQSSQPAQSPATTRAAKGGQGDLLQTVPAALHLLLLDRLEPERERARLLRRVQQRVRHQGGAGRLVPRADRGAVQQAPLAGPAVLHRQRDSGHKGKVHKLQLLQITFFYLNSENN